MGRKYVPHFHFSSKIFIQTINGTKDNTAANDISYRMVGRSVPATTHYNSAISHSMVVLQWSSSQYLTTKTFKIDANNFNSRRFKKQATLNDCLINIFHSIFTSAFQVVENATIYVIMHLQYYTRIYIYTMIDLERDCLKMPALLKILPRLSFVRKCFC